MQFAVAVVASTLHIAIHFTISNYDYDCICAGGGVTAAAQTAAAGGLAAATASVELFSDPASFGRGGARLVTFNISESSVRIQISYVVEESNFQRECLRNLLERFPFIVL